MHALPLWVVEAVSFLLRNAPSLSQPSQRAISFIRVCLYQSELLLPLTLDVKSADTTQQPQSEDYVRFAFLSQGSSETKGQGNDQFPACRSKTLDPVPGDLKHWLWDLLTACLCKSKQSCVVQLCYGCNLYEFYVTVNLGSSSTWQQSLALKSFCALLLMANFTFSPDRQIICYVESDAACQVPQICVTVQPPPEWSYTPSPTTLLEVGLQKCDALGNLPSSSSSP